jgi:N6-L-threonylcarbamoyladenine synthase
VETSSQTKLHARFGGVVPELAARRHTENILPLLEQTLRQARVTPSALTALAVTSGPGLITALQVGVETAKALALAWNKPLLSVNHITGHLVSPFLTKEVWPQAYKKTTWPAVALVVSGGHTELYLMKNISAWRLLGKTLDDAAGEAFDKVAKMLGLPYPGGPAVGALASTGNSRAFNFPRPLVNRPGYDFSFSGLKTAVLYALARERGGKKPNSTLSANLCASFQAAAVDVLVQKTLRAAEAYGARSIMVVGGVSANRALREAFTDELKKIPKGPQLLFPELRFTGDNAAMIALAGALAWNKPKNQSQPWQRIQANANWELWS